MEFGSPGYSRPYLVAVANAHGHGAPRTNVARYGLDDTRERDRLLSSVYSLYCEHITEEIEHLRRGGQFSLTWSTQEGAFLVSPLLEPRHEEGARLQKPALLREAIRSIPLAVVEFDGSRSAMAISDLHSHSVFWTIDCALFRSVEWFLREFPRDSSLRAVADAVANRAIELPSEPLLCHSVAARGASDLALVDREIDRVVIRQSQRRVDFRWVAAAEEPRWTRFPVAVFRAFPDARELVGHRRHGHHGVDFPMVARHSVEVDAEQQVGAVIRSNGELLVLPSCGGVADYLLERYAELEAEESVPNIMRCAYTSALFARFWGRSEPPDVGREEIVDWLERERLRQRIADPSGLRISELFEIDELMEIIRGACWMVFDPSVWERRAD